ncbi:hypothetical protein AC1031_006066 [Aphanomyces cochlioides]|nr:hypothetical protein AC1031_006066 [Aphanomyces cochlioides]
MAAKYPLPANFFRCPALNVDETARLLKSADDSALDLVRSSRLSGGPIKWTLKMEEKGVWLYKGVDPTTPNATTWLCTTEVLASIDEIVDLFRTDTTAAYQEFCRSYIKESLDGQRLYSLRRPSPSTPRLSVSIKWFACDTPTFVKPRDFCFTEIQTDFDLEGKTGWACAQKSVNLSCCPDLQNSLGLVRGTYHRAGICFLPSDRPGYLQVSQLVQADFRMPDVFTDMFAKKHCRAIAANLDTILRQSRLARGTFLHESDLVPRDSRTKCYVCQRKFGAFSKKGRCRKCGEVVCRKCSQVWDVTISGILTHRRVCTACSCGTVEVPVDANTIVDDPDDDQPDSPLTQFQATQQSQVRLWSGSRELDYDPHFRQENPRNYHPQDSHPRDFHPQDHHDYLTEDPHYRGFHPQESHHLEYHQQDPRHPYYHQGPPPSRPNYQQEGGMNMLLLDPGMPQQQLTQYHEQPHDVPYGQTTLVRKGGGVPPPHLTMERLQLEAPEDRMPVLGNEGEDDDDEDDEDLQSMYKDDMSNYSESMVSFQQSFRKPAFRPQRQQFPLHDHGPDMYGQPMRDPRRVPPQVRGTGPRGGPNGMPPHQYGHHQSPNYHGPGPRHPAPPMNHQRPRHSHNPQQHYHQSQMHSNFHPQHINQPQPPRSYPRRGRGQPQHQFVNPYTNQHQQQPPPPSDRRGPRPLHPQQQQYGYIAPPQQHQLLQDGDNGSSYGGSQDGRPAQESSRSNPYSNLYSFQPRDAPPSSRNDLILALPPPSPSSSSTSKGGASVSSKTSKTTPSLVLYTANGPQNMS